MIIDEHESPNKQADEDSAAYTPTDEERAILRLVNKHYYRAKQHREKYDHKWMDYYKMFRGKQWKDQRPSYRHSAVINLVFKIIQSHVPIQTDTFPKIEFLPQEPQDRELAQILSELAAADWDRQNWLLELIDIIYDANFYGIGFGGMEWDPDALDGQGDICFESKDPFYQFPDPNQRRLNDKRQRVYVEAEPIDVEILKAEYPDKAQWIGPDLHQVIEGDKTDLRDIRYRSPVDAKTIVEGSMQTSDLEVNKALKITLWMDDQEVEEQERKYLDENTGVEKTEYIKKRKHTKLRKICIAGNIVLSDGYVEYDDNQVPRASMVNYTLPREFFGISEIEQLEGLQITYNKIVSFVLDVLTLMGNPIWVISQDAQIDTDNLVNRPGLIVEPASANARVERQSGVQLQPYVIQMLQVIGNQIEEIAGSNDITKGQRPEGIVAARAIESLQEIGQTRLRQKAKYMDAFMRDIGRMYMARVFQFYTVPRVIRLTNKEEAQKYFRVSVDNGVDNEGNPTRVLNYTALGPQGEIVEQRQYDAMRNFDVKASTGSSLPFAKAERAQTALALFDRGIFDEQEVLTAHDYPNKEALLERIEQRKQQEAEAAAMQQGGQGQPQG